MAKRRKAAPNSNTASISSVVEKLSMLRSFLGDQSEFSETDLSTCLRQSGYSVELAAERLMTGQFQPQKTGGLLGNHLHNKNNKRLKLSSSTSSSTSNSNSAHVPVSSSSSSSRPSSSHSHKAPAETSSSTTTTTTPSITRRRNPHSSVNPSPTTTAISPKEPRKALRSVKTPPTGIKSTPASVTPKTPSSTAAKPKKVRRGVATTTAARMTSNSMVQDVDVDNDNDNDNNDGPKWLLCHRWISDGVCTQRQGSMEYQEALQLEFQQHSTTTTTTATTVGNQNLILLRFRGRNIQGQFPKHLGRFLTPLLQTNLIHIQTQALMGEHHLPIGAHIPLGVSVWLPDPQSFFALFDHDDQFQDKNAKFFFNNKNGKAKNNNNNNKPQLKELCDCAFALLQWAHHGETYDFDALDNNKDDMAKKGNNADDDGSDDEVLLLDEEASAAPERHGGPDWAQELEASAGASSSSKNNENITMMLPECEPPANFGATLRPYQKQALGWMIQREEPPENNSDKTSSRQQVQLLQELLALSSSTSTSSPLVLPSTDDDIYCECGPVLVRLKPKDAKNSEGTDDDDIAPAVMDNGISPDLNHPLWERRYICNGDRTKALSFYVQPLFGMATASPPPPPQPCRGGILADSMGLGKTVMLLALMQHTCTRVSHHNPKSEPDATPCDDTPMATLIVTPLSLLAQWEEELESRTTLTHRVHYGTDKKSLPDWDSVDVVLTTYGSLQAEWLAYSSRCNKLQKDHHEDGATTRKKKGISPTALPPIVGLLAHNWKRIILDEAHYVKNASTVAARACCLLKAERRWCVSGTIIQNSLEDVYSLLKFLKHEPWCEYPFWKAAITNEPERVKALDRVRRLLTPIMIRRTKNSLDKDGKPILTLPPVETKTIMVQFTPAERLFYDALHRKSLNLFEGFIKDGTASKSWLAIFSLLHRLRQTCDHVALTVKAHIDEQEWNSNICQETLDGTSSPGTKKRSKQDDIDQKFLDDLMAKFRSMHGKQSSKQLSEGGHMPYATDIAQKLNEAVSSNKKSLQDECPVCFENINMHDSVITPCFHIFCKDCLVSFLRNKATSKKSEDESKEPILRCPNGPCPICNEEIDSTKILRISETEGKIQTSYLLSSLKSPECTAIKEEDGAARQALETAIQGSNSSKLTAVLQELDKVWDEDPGSKVLIFSQFLGFLDLMEQAFKPNKIPFARLDGKLSLKERMAVLQEFGSAPTNKAQTNETESKVGSVLLISMKAGGVGLNLVSARTVMITDPWWNGAVEDQCVDRIHRIGQTADKVRVRKFYVENSVEERIVQLQKKKKNVANEILDKGDASPEGASARPTLEDFKILFYDNATT